jgi:hypothetical protein
MIGERCVISPPVGRTCLTHMPICGRSRAAAEPRGIRSLRIIKPMLEPRGKRPVLDIVWVLLTGPIVVFAVTDWFLGILPTPASVAVSLVALAGCVALARRWDRSDGNRRSKPPRGYRGRHAPHSTDSEVGWPAIRRGPGD